MIAPSDAELDAFLVEHQRALEEGRVPPSADGLFTRLDPAALRRLQHAMAVQHLLIGSKSTVNGARPSNPSARHVQQYEIVEEIGRGGMGVVYRALDSKLRRTVALKMLLHGVNSAADVRQRFLVEAEAAAQLRHPNVVTIFEVGEQDGLPFLAMEFVEGGSLADRLDGTPWPPRDAAALVETLARAAHEAHRHGIIHRDLKPANVLSADVPKISDFGLAKQLNSIGATRSDAILGTPAYMAPEQAAGQSKLVGPATDVYSIGVMLYELLTGRPPFCGASDTDTLLQVLNREAVPLRDLQPGVPRDLATICHKCLEKDPARRYVSAEDLAEDLARFRRNEPIHARTASVMERLAKFTRRHPTLAVMVGTLSVAFVAVVWLWQRADSARAGEADQRLRTERLLYANNLGQVQTDWQAGHFQRASTLLDQYRTQPNLIGFEWHYWQNRLRGHVMDCPRHRHWIGALWVDTNGHVVTFGSDGIIKWDPTTDKTLRIRLAGMAVANMSSRLSENGCFAAWSRQEDMIVWDSHSGQRLSCWKLPGGGSGPEYMAGSVERNWWARSDELGRIELYDLTSGRPINQIDVEAAAFCKLAPSPDGKMLAAASDSNLWVISPTTGRVLRHLSLGGQVQTMKFADHGGRLAIVVHDTAEKLQVIDAEAGTILTTFDVPLTFSLVAVDANANVAAAAHADGHLRIWDLKSGKCNAITRRPFPKVSEGSFLHDGRKLVFVTEDYDVKVWDTRLPDVRQLAIAEQSHNYETIFTAAFLSDNRRIVAGTSVGRVVLWDAASGERKWMQCEHSNQVYAVAVSPDAKLVASASEGNIIVWDAETGDRLGLIESPGSWFFALAFSTDGRQLIGSSNDTSSKGGHVRIWSVESKSLVAEYVHPDRVMAFGLTKGGRLLVTACSDRCVRVWDTTREPNRGPIRMIGQGDLDAVRPSPDDPLVNLRLALSPDSDTVAIAGPDHTVRFFSVRTGAFLNRQCDGHTRGVIGLTFSPVGDRLATIGREHLLRLWDVATGKEVLAHSIVPAKSCHSVAFSPDGCWLAIGCGDGAIDLLDGRSIPQVR